MWKNFVKFATHQKDVLTAASRSMCVVTWVVASSGKKKYEKVTRKIYSHVLCQEEEDEEGCRKINKENVKDYRRALVF